MTVLPKLQAAHMCSLGAGEEIQQAAQALHGVADVALVPDDHRVQLRRRQGGVAKALADQGNTLEASYGWRIQGLKLHREAGDDDAGAQGPARQSSATYTPTSDASGSNATLFRWAALSAPVLTALAAAAAPGSAQTGQWAGPEC